MHCKMCCRSNDTKHTLRDNVTKTLKDNINTKYVDTDHNK